MVGHGVEQSFMQRNDFTAQIGIIKIKRCTVSREFIGISVVLIMRKRAVGFNRCGAE